MSLTGDALLSSRWLMVAWLAWPKLAVASGDSADARPRPIAITSRGEPAHDRSVTHSIRPPQRVLRSGFLSAGVQVGGRGEGDRARRMMFNE